MLENENAGVKELKLNLFQLASCAFTLNFTHLSQPLVLENENAGVEELNFHLLRQPLVLENEIAGVQELNFHLFKPASGA